METLMYCLEILGTAAFAMSGALTALKKNMDIFGVCVLGLITAVGGGFMRDITLGLFPPTVFSDYRYAIISIVISLIIFFPTVRKVLFINKRAFEFLLLISDSAGLAVFTVCGANIAIEKGYENNPVLLVFIAVLTGVGGGVLRDVLAGDRPYIFVKHIYAVAVILGAIIYLAVLNFSDSNAAAISGMLSVFAIRMMSAKFRLSLPKSNWNPEE